MLGYLDKGHSPPDMVTALDLATSEGLTLRPTWVAFTPWGSVEDYVEMLDFIERRGLIAHTQSVQYALRLLLPPGSPLVPLLEEQGLLGAYDDRGLSYGWTNPDTRIDALQTELAAIVEEAPSLCGHDETLAVHRGHDIETFTRVKRAALAALGRGDESVMVADQPAAPAPRLTEDWFC